MNGGIDITENNKFKGHAEKSGINEKSLFIMGEHAHSRYFSEDVYEMAAEPKELYVVPEAGYVDLYDKIDLIPFDKLESFFTEKM